MEAPPPIPRWIRITSLSPVNLERHVVIREPRTRNTIFSNYILHLFFIYLALAPMGGSSSSTLPPPWVRTYIPLIREPRRRGVDLRGPRTRDTFLPHRKLMRTLKSNNSLNAYLRLHS